MHIAIIGAGVAGIAAAQSILADAAAGHTVTLFEASDRYGGRALSDDASIPGFVLEAGATQLQDPDINPLVAVANQLGFAMTDEPFRPGWMRMQGAAGWANVATQGDAQVNAVDAQLDADYDLAKAQPNLVAAPPFPALGQTELLALLNTGLGPIAASAEPWQYLAADHARESTADLGENQFVTRGIGTLVEAWGATLAAFGNRFTVRMSSPVQAVAWTDVGVQVSGDGFDVAADGCIVTLPVSLLAAGTIAFAPALSPAHQAALQALRLGSYKKLAVALTQVPADIVVENTYSIADVARAGAWEFRRTGGMPDVLFAQTAGDFAAWLDTQADDDVFEMLRALLQSTYAQPLVFGAQRAITNWTNAPFARGAYSYTAPIGADPNDPTALGARQALAAPQGRLRIAGEATNETWFGTLQAAYFEGVRAAGELLLP